MCTFFSHASCAFAKGMFETSLFKYQFYKGTVIIMVNTMVMCLDYRLYRKPKKEPVVKDSKINNTMKKSSPRQLSEMNKSRKTSTTSKTDSMTSKTTPKKKTPMKETVHQREDIEEDGWTEAYIRARMKNTDSSKELDLSSKMLEEIPPDVFSIKEVEILDMSNNPLGSIPVGIASLSELKEIRAAGCDIREISGNVSRCKYLSKIDFSRNPHIATLPVTMKQLAHLKYVALSSCELKSLPKNLTLLATIETLDVSKNVLTTLPSEVSGFKRMKVLILNDNAFERIPESIKSLGRLDRVEMKKNKLNNHQGDLKLNVPSRLKILDLEDNCSLSLIPDGLENLEVIEGLNFSYCGIEKLPDSIGQIPTLKEIHLAGNKLRTLPDSFGRLLNLETLDLEGNLRLSSLPVTLHHLRKLKDKDTGKNTGLVMDNVPTLDIPGPKIVKEGVISVLSELLTEDSLNSVTSNIAAEVVDDTIIENLSDDIVTIIEEGLSDDLMLEMIEVAVMEGQCADDVFASIFEDVVQALIKEVSQETADEDKIILLIIDNLLDETKGSVTTEVATSAVRLDAAAWEVMEELLREVTDATTKSVALEHEEEWRLGQTVPEQYDKQFSYKISATSVKVQSVDLPAGCNLSIPPEATTEDTSVISAVLNPHGYEGTLELEDNELLVSDIVEMRPAGMTFSKPVKLKIPHSLPKFDKEREYVVMTSEDDGTSWETLKTLSHHEKGQTYVVVEVVHFSSFAVVARPLEHCHRVRKGEASELKSSKQTGIKMILPRDCVPSEEEISFKVIPVDKETLTCAGMEDSGMDINRMSHILKFFKGSNLLLNRPATIVLPLSPGEEDSQVRVLSCSEIGDWEDVTDKVDDVVLKESKVAFKTDRLSSGFTVLRSDKIVDPNRVVALVTKNTRVRRTRTVIFKKWKGPREKGVMTARMECVLEEMVEDRICRAETKEGYERQGGTPTPTMSMMEGETFCAIFHGSIRPKVEEINYQYGVNFKFYCNRPRIREFDVTLVDKGKSATSTVKFYPGPREIYHPCAPGEKGTTPLATAEITAPTGIICDYWLACQRFKNTLGIADTYLSPDHNKCFCKTCHTDRGGLDSYSRGNPRKKYAAPVGWGRVGLKPNRVSEDKEVNVFTNWHRAYHGTVTSTVKKILQTSQLLMPGDTALGGHHLGERPGHFNEKRKPEGFDTQQVYLSPSIEYSGDDIYAHPTRFKDKHGGKEYDVRVALQLCVRPNSYTVGPETIGARREGRTIDPLFSNDELEWFTKERGGHVLYGLLVKLEKI
ncbi:NEURL4 [Branchiostoma lanceolatum]|uniref:Protein Sur-8 homolog n=2 Tax=Branchiostoma lanceolatum TaxID=7740 RepID=A0A8K0EIW5_BRALA|nr:NEURL4 [Branchiostoma lanceolatum]